jgi:hypothetical protein
MFVFVFLRAPLPQTKTLHFQQELFIGMCYDSSVAHFHTFEIAPETGAAHAGGGGALLLLSDPHTTALVSASFRAFST